MHSRPYNFFFLNVRFTLHNQIKSKKTDTQTRLFSSRIFVVWAGFEPATSRSPADCRVHTIYMIFNLTRLSYLLTNGNIRIILLTSYNLFYKIRLTQNCQNSKIKYFIYLSN